MFIILFKLKNQHVIVMSNTNIFHKIQINKVPYRDEFWYLCTFMFKVNNVMWYQVYRDIHGTTDY